MINVTCIFVIMLGIIIIIALIGFFYNIHKSNARSDDGIDRCDKIAGQYGINTGVKFYRDGSEKRERVMILDDFGDDNGNLIVKFVKTDTSEVLTMPINEFVSKYKKL